jgi:murein DD-endopeptidase MepM/ murein hydrolase activator NlpD
LRNAGLLKTVFWRLLTVSWLVSLVSAVAAQDNYALLQAAQFPEIGSLKKGDVLFDQLTANVSAYYQAAAQAQPLPPIQLFRYQVHPGETLFTIGARVNIPPAGIATLNRLSSSDLTPNQEILLPNTPGLFVPLAPKTRLEQMLFVRMQPEAIKSRPVNFLLNGVAQLFQFHPEKDFSPEERKIFLGRMFHSPLDKAWVSSTFGNRRNPFTGTVLLHAGVDLAAPQGTPVHSIGDGVVDDTGWDLVYGNYVFVDHQNGYRSFYAHFQSVSVKKNQLVHQGDVLGLLGSTGQVTGAHLHIEIHQNGMAKDPLLYFTP